MSRVFLDTGHGQNNARPGVYDPGAVSAYGKEAEVVRTVAAALLPKLVALGVDARMAPDGSITSRVAWQARTLQTGDLFVSLHMNSGAFSGTSVYYAADKPHLKDEATQLSADLASRLGTRDEGGRPDTQTAVRRVAVLHAHPTAAQLLVECGRIGYKPDVTAVLAKGADALAAGIARLLHLPAMPTLTPEQQAAWDRMKALGVFSAYTVPGTPVTTELLGVFLERLWKALGK